jgi:hypothetical protein
MTTSNSDPDLRDEYDFSNGVRGKYAERYPRGTNLVLLDADVAEVFATTRDVNTALRSLIRLQEDLRNPSP